MQEEEFTDIPVISTFSPSLPPEVLALINSNPLHCSPLSTQVWMSVGLLVCIHRGEMWKSECVSATLIETEREQSATHTPHTRARAEAQ